MKSIKSDGFEVGFGKPPKATKFRKGRSGNRKGRELGSENMLAVFRRHAMRRVKVRSSDGSSKTLSVAEAILAKNYQEAMKGNDTCMSNIMKLAELGGEFFERNDSKVVGKPLFFPESGGSLEELMKEMGSEIIHVGRPQTDD